MMQIMNSSEYNDTIEKIKPLVQYYEAALENNKYTLGLANGDYINLTFPKNHIPHLLGIHIDSLRGASITKISDSAYDTLKELIDGDISYYDMTNKNFDVSNLFSDYVDAKLEIFTDILKVRTNDLYCIIKYNSERTYTTGEEKENSEYFIIRRHNKKFSVLGITRQGEKNNYVPVTARLFENYDELREFLSKTAKNQEITYASTYKVENYAKKYAKSGYPSIDDKIEFNSTLKDVSYKFNAIPSTNRDFLATLERLQNNRQKNSNNFSILNMIKDNVISGNITDLDEVTQLLDDSEIPEDIRLLIDACNDLVCSDCKSDESVSNSYSSIQRENINLKDELKSLKDELLTLKDKVKELENDNSLLKEVNNDNSSKLKILTDAFESISK